MRARVSVLIFYVKSFTAVPVSHTTVPLCACVIGLFISHVKQTQTTTEAAAATAANHTLF